MLRNARLYEKWNEIIAARCDIVNHKSHISEYYTVSQKSSHL